jgi:hypothetical protein
MVKPDFKDLVKDLEKRNQDNKNRDKELTDQQTVVRSLDLVQRAVVQSIGILIQTLLEDTLKTQVTNQKDFPKSFGTPDALAGAQTVKSAIKELEQAVIGKDIDLSGVLTHLEGIHGVLNKLPTEYPSFPDMPTEMAINNLGEMCEKLDAIGLELQSLKLDPKIEVKTPEVKIDLSKEIKQIEKAVKSISKEVKIPEQKETDLSPLIKAMNSVKSTIENIQFPVPNFRTQDIVDELQQIKGFDIPVYDEIDLAYTGDNLTSVVYKKDDVTVATLTLAYTGTNLTNVTIG